MSQWCLNIGSREGVRKQERQEDSGNQVARLHGFTCLMAIDFVLILNPKLPILLDHLSRVWDVIAKDV
jgi:hypothetical protein